MLILWLFMTYGAQAQTAKPFTQTGGCSYYGDEFNGRHTSSGERFDNKKFTAAHRTLPFGTILKVTNLQKNKVTFVRINDRGPFVNSRIIDVSKAAAKELELIKYGHCRVKVEFVGNSDSTDYTRMVHYKIPTNFSDSILLPKRYYNISGDELSVKKAYSLEIKSFDHIDDVKIFAKQCLENGMESAFFKVTEEVTGRKYTFYYGCELYETKPLDKLSATLTGKGYTPKLVRLY